MAPALGKGPGNQENARGWPLGEPGDAGYTARLLSVVNAEYEVRPLVPGGGEGGRGRVRKISCQTRPRAPASSWSPCGKLLTRMSPPASRGSGSECLALHLGFLSPAPGEASEDSVGVKPLSSGRYSFMQTFTEGGAPGSMHGVDGKAHRKRGHHGQQSQKLCKATA